MTCIQTPLTRITLHKSAIPDSVQILHEALWSRLHTHSKSSVARKKKKEKNYSLPCLDLIFVVQKTLSRTRLFSWSINPRLPAHCVRPFRVTFSLALFSLLIVVPFFSRMAIFLRREPKTRLWGILFGFQLRFNKRGKYCLGGIRKMIKNSSSTKTNQQLSFSNYSQSFGSAVSTCFVFHQST